MLYFCRVLSVNVRFRLGVPCQFSKAKNESDSLKPTLKRLVHRKPPKP